MFFFLHSFRNIYRPLLKLLTRQHFEMRQIVTTILLFDLWLNASFASAGIFDSFFLGLHSVSSGTAINGHAQQPTSQSTVDEQTDISNSTGYWHTNSSSVSVPIADGDQLRVDLCEGDITVPLSFDVRKETVIKSTNFPFKRSTPLICLWNVKATTNCRRGLITMTINERSRLADVDGCLNGYYTVSPFMEKTKICGRVNSVPAFRWYVEHDQPENVTITLRHIGLNDGYSEGLSFNLSGDCLPNRDDTTISTAWESYGSWIQQLSKAQATGGPTVVLPSMPSSPTLPSVSNDSIDSLQNASIERIVNMTTATSTDMPTTSSSSQVQLLLTTPIGHPIVVDPKDQNQTNVSNHSSTVDLPARQNITFTVYPPTYSMDVLPPAGSRTQRPRHRPPSAHHLVDVKNPEDQSEIPWLILKPAGQSLSKTHRTPRPWSSLTQPAAIVIPADVLPPNVHSAEKTHHHTESEMPSLVLKTHDSRNEYSPNVHLFRKKPLYQPDPIKEDINPSYDDDEFDDTWEPHPVTSLNSSTDAVTQEAAFSAESPQIYSSNFEDDDVDGHGQQVDIRQDENAIPWLILKSPNHHLVDTQSKPTNIRPAFNISRAPLPMSKSSIRLNGPQSSKKQTPVNYDPIPTKIVPIDAVNLKSKNRRWSLPGYRPSDGAISWTHSVLSKPATTVDSQSFAPTTRSNHLPIPLHRNPLLAFDD